MWRRRQYISHRRGDHAGSLRIDGAWHSFGDGATHACGGRIIERRRCLSPLCHYCRCEHAFAAVAAEVGAAIVVDVADATVTSGYDGCVVLGGYPVGERVAVPVWPAGVIFLQRAAVIQ